MVYGERFTRLCMINDKDELTDAKGDTLTGRLIR